MCGINGILFFSEPLFDGATLVKIMNDSISHRGPDDEGVWEGLNGRLFLGHRRLSILDLSVAGHQPMTEGNTTIVYNGEIYNYKELKLKHGFTNLTSTGDTEVLAKLLNMNDDSLIHELNGMFAFASWGEKDQILTLVRDRVGIKPLYYVINKDYFAFSSEVQALLKLPNDLKLKHGVSSETVNNYLTSNRQSSNNTIFNNIKKLAPSSIMKVRPNGDYETSLYWKISTKVDNNMSESDAAHGLISKLEEAVSRQLTSDVPVGVFLSGGVDSSALVALMRKKTSSTIKTYSVGFENVSSFDERHYAKKVSKLFGTEHTEIILCKQDLEKAIPQMVNIFDDPLSDPTSIPINFLCQKAKKDGTKVILTGDGADEVFFGYKSWAKYKKYSTIFNFLKRNSRICNWLSNATNLINVKHPLIKQFIYRANNNLPLYIPGSGGMKQGVIESITNSIGFTDNQELNSIRIEEDFLKLQLGEINDINWMCYAGMDDILPNYFLYRADKLSTANSIEIRVPFLDHELIEFAFKCPQKYKLKNDQSKYILKKSLEGILPQEILYRKKMGFCVPIQEWLIDIIVVDLLENVILSNQIEPLFNIDGVNKLVKEFFNGNKVKASDLWSIYFLSKWIQRWLK